MQEQKILKNQQEWEGFQEFCQLNSEKQTKSIRETALPNQTMQLISNPQDKLNIEKETVDKKPKTSPHKKSKSKIKQDEREPPSQTSELLIQTQQQPNDKNLEINQPSSPNIISLKHNKLQRIPIMRKQDDYRYYGSVIYRSFAPRSSQTYFRTLKQVDYSAISSTKMKGVQNLQFNSRIQSGNLGCVFQGWIKLI